MVHCVAFGCNNSSKKKIPGQKLHFFTFPRDKSRREVWLKLLRRENYVWKEGHRLCSDHFDKSKYEADPVRMAELGYPNANARLKTDAVPTFNYSATGPKQNIAPKKRGAYTKRRKLETLNEALAEYSAAERQADSDSTDTASENEDEPNVATQSNFSHVEVQARPDTMPRYVQAKPETLSKGTFAMVEKCSIGCQATPIPITKVDAATQTEDGETLEQAQDQYFDEGHSDVEDMDFQDLDNEELDPTYLPEGEEADEVEVIDPTAFQQPHTERKYVVSQSSLLNLFLICPEQNCPCAARNQLRTVGSMLVITTTCSEGHLNTWYSQPTHRGMPWGNLCLAAATVLSGSTYKKISTFLKHLKVPVISETTFYQMQRAYIVPVIVDHWTNLQEVHLSMLEGHEIAVAGDGRCDSPGYCAKYCSYTLMDTVNNKILDTQLMQSNEVASSTHMELEGLKRSLAVLKEKGVKVTNVVTDRHSQVKKYMREEHPDKIHEYDVWHVAKGTEKKLMTLSRTRDGKDIGPWIASIKSHLYWVAASSGYNGEQKRAKWLSLLNHITNKHSDHSPYFPECLHGHLEEDREWLKKGSVAYKLLEPIINSNFLVKDVAKLSPVHQTYGLEVFHRVVLMFAPKNLHFFYWSMTARTYLAALHYNENSENVQARTFDGQLRYRPAYPKKYRGDRVVIKPIKENPTFDYVSDLLDAVADRRNHYHSFRIAIEDARRLTHNTPPPLTASYVHLNKEYLIARHKSRFQKQ